MLSWVLMDQEKAHELMKHNGAYAELIRLQDVLGSDKSLVENID